MFCYQSWFQDISGTLPVPCHGALNLFTSKLNRWTVRGVSSAASVCVRNQIYDDNWCHLHSTTHTLQSSDRRKIREFLFVQTEERERDTPMPEVLVPGYCQQSTHNSNEQWWGSASVKYRVCVQNHFNMTHRGCSVTQLLLPFREKCQAGEYGVQISNCLHDRVSKSLILMVVQHLYASQLDCENHSRNFLRHEIEKGLKAV